MRRAPKKLSIRKDKLSASISTPEIEELFRALGQVSVRRLFGGKGVYHCGVIIAVEIAGEMRLKADAISAPEFELAGATQWSYEGSRRTVLMPYWSIPPDVFDDSEKIARWVRLAFEAALRSKAPLKSPSLSA